MLPDQVKSTETSASTTQQWDWYATTQKLLAFVTTKAYTDNVVTKVWDVTQSALTSKATLPVNHQPTCWWSYVETRNEAYAVFTARIRPSWHEKHAQTLGLPRIENCAYCTFFAVVRGDGIPVLQPLMGFCPDTWENAVPIAMVQLEPGVSNALTRQQAHWAQLAMAAWTQDAAGAMQICTPKE